MAADPDLEQSPLLVKLLPLIALFVLLPVVLVTTSLLTTNTFFFGLSDPRVAGLLGRHKSGPVSSNASNQGRKLRVFTEKELSRYDGASEALPIYLSIKGRVYDVSSGRQHYQKGSGYNFFAGKDATRSFITGCFNDECFQTQTKGLDGLTEKELTEVDSWIKTYEEKYTLVGFLRGYFEEFHYPEAEELLLARKKSS